MNTTTTYFALQVLLLLGVSYVLFRAIVGGRTYFMLRGKRLVTCPETNRPAAVELDAKLAAVTSVFGMPKLRIGQCSRWPERRNCGQCCLKQIGSSGGDTLVANTISRWYTGQRCIACHRAIAKIEEAALVGRDRASIKWRQIPAPELADVLSTHSPVCEECHLAEILRREHRYSILEHPCGRVS